MTAAPGQGSQGALGFVTVTFSSTLTFVQYETTQTRWSLQVTGLVHPLLAYPLKVCSLSLSHLKNPVVSEALTRAY